MNTSLIINIIKIKYDYNCITIVVLILSQTVLPLCNEPITPIRSINIFIADDNENLILSVYRYHSNS